MSWLNKTTAKCVGLFSRRRACREFDDEVQGHITMLTERFIRQGMTEQEAVNAARRQFGNTTVLKEVRTEMQTFAWLEVLWQDLRYGLRILSNNKAFAIVAILTLALGIGANTAIFSVVNAALLRPLPYPDPGRLAILWGNVKRVKVERRGASYPDYIDWRNQSRSFTAMAAFSANQFALTGLGMPELISGEYVSQPYFSLLGIQPERGRLIRPDGDQAPQRDAVAILSDGAWKGRFGSDPAIIGRVIELDGRAYTVVGVAPPGFRGLTDQAEVWLPFVMSGSAADLHERGNRDFQVLARLRSGVSLAQAQAEMNAIAKRLERSYPETNEARGVELSPLERETVGDIRKPLLILLGAVGLVLLIACTNVANLLLARSEARQREIAVRLALGAGRGRVLRQFVAESAILVMLGCSAGLLIAHYGVSALMASSPVTFPTYVKPGLDPVVALFTAAVCCGIAFILGLSPIYNVRTTGVHEALKQSSGRSIDTRGRQGFRNALVVAEVSLSMVLLVSAGLLIRSLGRITALNPGYDPAHILMLQVSLPGLQPATLANANGKTDNPDKTVVETAGEILRQVSKVPSVQSASIASDVPLGGSSAIFYSAEGQPPTNAQSRPRAYFHRVSSEFFHTLHIPFTAGRTFTQYEVHGNANVAVVSENLARRFWPGQDPVGKRIKVGGAESPRPWLTIIGVVNELKYRGLPNNPTADPDLFQVFNERSRDFSVLVRTSVDAASISSSVRNVLRQAEPLILISKAATLDEFIGHETARPRFTGWLMTIFAGMALLLAAIGIYGVMSYTVLRRTREIGLRVALGANRLEVLHVIVGRGMRLVGTGLALGMLAAAVFTRFLSTVLYEVRSTDPLTFAAAALTLACVAFVACVVPALRSTQIDPAVTLRNE